MSFALVDALDDASVNLNVELGGHKPAGKTSAAHAVQVAALAPPATQGGDAESPRPTTKGDTDAGMSTCK